MKEITIHTVTDRTFGPYGQWKATVNGMTVDVEVNGKKKQRCFPWTAIEYTETEWVEPEPEPWQEAMEERDLELHEVA